MKAIEITDSSELPDCVDDLDGWEGKVLFDQVYQRRFSILPAEVNFYKKHRVAPPTVHHVKRVKDLIQSSNIGVFKEHHCVECKKEIMISVNPKYPDRKIYCHECYLKYLEQHG